MTCFSLFPSSFYSSLFSFLVLQRGSALSCCLCGAVISIRILFMIIFWITLNYVLSALSTPALSLFLFRSRSAFLSFFCYSKVSSNARKPRRSINTRNKIRKRTWRLERQREMTELKKTGKLLLFSLLFFFCCWFVMHGVFNSTRRLRRCWCCCVLLPVATAAAAAVGSG